MDEKNIEVYVNNGKGHGMQKSSLRAYRQKESNDIVVTHVNIFDGDILAWLYSYGLSSWMVVIGTSS